MIIAFRLVAIATLLQHRSEKCIITSEPLLGHIVEWTNRIGPQLSESFLYFQFLPNYPRFLRYQRFRISIASTFVSLFRMCNSSSVPHCLLNFTSKVLFFSHHQIASMFFFRFNEWIVYLCLQCVLLCGAYRWGVQELSRTEISYLPDAATINVVAGLRLKCISTTECVRCIDTKQISTES